MQAIFQGLYQAWLAALARAERDFSARMVRYGQQAAGIVGATGVPTTAQVVAAATARPFQGRFLQDWLREAEECAAKRAREVIRQGFIEGRSAVDVARQLRGTRANQYRDGVLEVSRRGAEAMVRTANSHYASVAARETYLALGVTKVRFIATLDTRTTIIRILAPAGSRGLNVERVSSFGEGEREVLLARGQRLKVVSYDHATRTITARLLAYRL